MGEVGFPGFAALNRRTIRGPVNPLDKCTVVSVYPKLIKRRNPTIQPGFFKIEAGTALNPATLIVGSSSWWRELDEDQPLVEIPHGSIQIANSIIQDYCQGLLGVRVPDRMPGLFYIQGEHSIKDIQKTHKHLIDRAIEAQKLWFITLVELGDGLWAASGGHPRSVSDEMRMAARELALEGKDWMQNFVAMQQVKCIACGALRNPEFPICGTCHTVVDKAKYDALNLVTAK